MLTTFILTAMLGATPNVGDVVPDFTATDTSGKAHTLSRLLQKGPVIVAFFPKAFTPGCTRELKAYRDRYSDILEAKGQVLAVSVDDADTSRRFKEELKAPFPFIPDEEGKLTRLFDVKAPVVSFAKRYTFVIGPGRKVLEVSSGSDAIDPTAAVRACSLEGRPRAADGGR